MRGFLEVSFVFFPKKETLWDLVCKKEMPCKDGLFHGGLLLPPNQALFLWLVSWLNLFIGIFGLYRNYPSLAFSPLFVFFTSLNYWRKPIYGWRRNVDMLSVVLGSLFATSRSFYSERKVLFWIFGFMGCCGYGVSCYFHKNYYRSYPWFSTITHAFVHVCGCICNCLLFLDNIKYK